MSGELGKARMITMLRQLNKRVRQAEPDCLDEIYNYLMCAHMSNYDDRRCLLAKNALLTCTETASKNRGKQGFNVGNIYRSIVRGKIPRPGKA
eukprot:GILJ01004760.1.p1 GENE.GILJ01004760.1~~GILJ01004760.1.p1  ORF type:complete len:108 (+),score=7.80 GILJ01004760.1:47-325(+)